MLGICPRTGIESMLIQIQLRWVGQTHPQNSLIRVSISGKPRSIGRPLLRYKDNLNANLKSLGISGNWEQLVVMEFLAKKCKQSLFTFEKIV